jgi:hypothetical protein
VRPVFLIISLVSLISCFNQGDCLINSTNLVKIGLRKRLDYTTKQAIFLKVAAVTESDTIDFPLLENVSLESLSLPLDPKNLVTSYHFLTSDSLTFQLTLAYTQSTKIISPDCGAFIYYNDLSVAGTNFDSTRVVKHQLLISVARNLEVFF